ncbi:unnamed protein product [Linum trigynum]|uniref:Uncharacterized protein n=1 Tax=Linum trigynum TaxID=586398 RepID=A0AAV2EXW6_9ROSI
MKKEAMACTLDCRYLDKDFGDKTYKRKCDAEATATTDNDNSESMVIESSLPLSAKQSMAPSTVNLDMLTLMITTYDEVISRRVSGRSWKHFRKRRVWEKIESRQAAFEEQMKKLKRGQQAS